MTNPGFGGKKPEIPGVIGLDLDKRSQPNPLKLHSSSIYIWGVPGDDLSTISDLFILSYVNF